MRIAIVASTGGSVYRTVCTNAHLASQIALVLSDRECGAIETARAIGHEAIIYPWRDGEAFSDLVLQALERAQIDLCLSFYTRLFRGRLLEAYDGRLLNFHPSILPAFPGRDGFGDTIRAGAAFVGSTVHLVDAGIDTGPPVLQASYPRGDEPIEQLRHRVFQQQCKSFLQVARWYEQGRVSVLDRRVIVRDAGSLPGEYSPNLDDVSALTFTPQRRPANVRTSL